MLYRQAAIPAQNPLLSGEEGLTLPVSPLPSTSSKELVLAQRAAFEAGLPPPQAQREGSVAVEDGRGASTSLPEVAGVPWGSKGSGDAFD